MDEFLKEVAAALRASGIPAAEAAAKRLAALGPIPGFAEEASPPTHLGAALAARTAHPAVRHLVFDAARLPWTAGSFVMPQGFAGRYSYCDIASLPGSDGDGGFSFGLYLQQPESWYPMHSHAAEEVYFILSGTAQWSRDGVDAVAEAPGSVFRHAPHERHATRTGPEPLLAAWFWLGDQSEASYRIDES